jgi:hypothetical protein
LGTVEVAHS